MSALEQLDRIAVEGTRKADWSTESKPSNLIECADGFKVSVVAGLGAYCAPRPDGYSKTAAPRDYEGPYTAVEVGFPSARPEPWDEWEPFCESPEYPTGTVYGYVPIDQVRALVAAHEGVTL